MNTENNPAYGLSHSYERTKDDYEYIQSSPGAPQRPAPKKTAPLEIDDGEYI